ncbi:MAG: MBL fold metallo-hydrolase [Thermomicrobiales bacterium]
MAETSRLEIIQIAAGPIETNLFLVIEKSSKKTMLIDGPPDSLEATAREIASRDLEPELLVITHGHWDHIADADALRSKYDIPLLVHEDDRHKLENPTYGDIQGFSPDRIIGEETGSSSAMSRSRSSTLPAIRRGRYRSITPTRRFCSAATRSSPEATGRSRSRMRAPSRRSRRSAGCSNCRTTSWSIPATA